VHGGGSVWRYQINSDVDVMYLKDMKCAWGKISLMGLENTKNEELGLVCATPHTWRSRSVHGGGSVW
jgi:hypothetical protein